MTLISPSSNLLVTLPTEVSMPLLPQGSAEAGNDAQGSYHRLPDEPDDSMSAETIRNDSTPAHDVSGGRQPPGNLNGDPICSSPTTSPTLGSSPTLASSPSLHGPLKRWSTGGASLLMTAEYSRGRQFRHQLWQFFLRLFLSGAILGLIYACFTFGEKAGILDRTQKHVFNAVYLGLSLLLGLNLVSSYKEMADVFRWTFAASNQYGGHTAREFDTILGMSSYQNCAKLLKYWFPKQKHFWIVFIWLFLGIVCSS